jgi:hypothetical protein
VKVGALQRRPINRLDSGEPRRTSFTSTIIYGFQHMILNRLWLLFPGRRTVLTVLFSGAVGAALAIGASVWIADARKPAPSPAPLHDPRFAALGKAYLPHLGRAYAKAWEEGAKKLEAGAGISVALEAVSTSWSSNRTQVYDQMITPELSKIVTESIKDADVTPQERAAMAAAWRGLSVGLSH